MACENKKKWKRKGSSMFTQTEIEAARQLVELSNSTTCTHLHQVEDVLAEVEEDERLRRRNNRYRYIQDLYNSR
ncbi:hypothetical protein JHK82_041415 [Glycine max]|nr:hypothetical protein JHK86_041472 [Glycine max]KAG5104445.1 hypothetical protein JHK82_041415 [Glycine max]